MNKWQLKINNREDPFGIMRRFNTKEDALEYLYNYVGENWDHPAESLLKLEKAAMIYNSDSPLIKKQQMINTFFSSRPRDLDYRYSITPEKSSPVQKPQDPNKETIFLTPAMCEIIKRGLIMVSIREMEDVLHSHGEGKYKTYDGLLKLKKELISKFN